MGHTTRDKKKLLDRVNRLAGQVEAIKRALEQEKECGDVLRLIAATRGAMNSLMAEVLEGHLLEHAFAGARLGSKAAQAADEVIEIVHAYLK
jgi:FrmR/RcnR family transcriptional regulator, repressor of frmRAB operon